MDCDPARVEDRGWILRWKPGIPRGPKSSRRAKKQGDCDTDDGGGLQFSVRMGGRVAGDAPIAAATETVRPDPNLTTDHTGQTDFIRVIGVIRGFHRAVRKKCAHGAKILRHYGSMHGAPSYLLVVGNPCKSMRSVVKESG